MLWKVSHPPVQSATNWYLLKWAKVSAPHWSRATAEQIDRSSAGWQYSQRIKSRTSFAAAECQTLFSHSRGQVTNCFRQRKNSFAQASVKTARCVRFASARSCQVATSDLLGSHWSSLYSSPGALVFPPTWSGYLNFSLAQATKISWKASRGHQWCADVSIEFAKQRFQSFRCLRATLLQS